MSLRLPPRRRRARPGDVVPMINIVFLLLVFFMLTATIVPPDPLQVTPPEAEAEAGAAREAVLHVAADGGLALRAHRDAEVFAALADWPADQPLVVQADAALEGAAFAVLLRRLAEAGVAEAALVVRLP